VKTRTRGGVGIFDDDFELSVSELETISSELDINALLARLLKRYGLKHAVYHAVALPGVPDANPLLLLTYPEEWVKRYVSQNYFAIDPVVIAGATNLLPIDWDSLDLRGRAARQVFGEAAELGIGRHGLTFPIRGARNDHALFTVTSDVPSREWQNLRKAYMRDFQILGHFVHGKVLEIHHGTVPPYKPLSPRERECLHWAAQGLINKQIANRLGISERVVRAYFESARHKLGCLNRGHVLARAVSLRIVGPASA
jgi:DNA-binding CsgD family transcriptional regulator